MGGALLVVKPLMRRVASGEGKALEGVLGREPVANVLFAHTPFLICTLTYFTIYGNAGIFVLFSGFPRDSTRRLIPQRTESN